MSIQMRGAEVAKAMKEKLIREREELNAAGVNPCLTIIRVGAKENDLAYERGAKKRMEMIGIECRNSVSADRACRYSDLKCLCSISQRVGLYFTGRI